MYRRCVFDGKDVCVWLATRFGKLSCSKVFPLMFEKKLDRENSYVFIVSLLVYLMVDQAHVVHSLCASEGSYALLNDVQN